MAYGDYTPTTELEAVNMMLEVLGEQPVNSIPASGISEATIARDILYRVSREVQKKGLNCNKEVDYPLIPNEDNQIEVPSNALYVDAYDVSKDYVYRAGMLYDKTEHSYTFTDTIKVVIVWFLPFDELPEHVRHYVSIKAARQFQSRMLSSAEVHSFTETDELAARADFMRAEIKTKDGSILQSTSIARTLLRRRF